VRKALAILAPPPTLTISEWADAKRRLSSEASAEPGQWRTDRAAYQRGIMDAISDPAVESVVVMSSARWEKRKRCSTRSASTSTRTRRRSWW
jgi:phage terminase large subunit GpA-like protein